MRAVRTVVLAALVVLAWAAPAAAAPSSGGPTWLRCRTSTASLSGVDGMAGAVRFTVAPCAAPRPTDALIVASYTLGLAPLGFVTPYPSAGSTGWVELAGGPGTAAVCLLTDPGTLVACARIVVDAGGTGYAVEPMPTDTPLTAGRVDLGPPGQTPDCAACF